MLTVRDIAARLRCGVSTAYELVRSGRIQSFRIGRSGGSIRVSEEQLQVYLESCMSSEPDEPAQPRPTPSRVVLKHLRL